MRSLTFSYVLLSAPAEGKSAIQVLLQVIAIALKRRRKRSEENRCRRRFLSGHVDLALSAFQIVPSDRQLGL
jgi:hypothetical protein